MEKKLVKKKASMNICLDKENHSVIETAEYGGK